MKYLVEIQNYDGTWETWRECETIEEAKAQVIAAGKTGTPARITKA